MVESGIILIKYWLEVSPDEQTRRLESRIDDPRKIWKLSEMDLQSYGRWSDYSRARDDMFAATDTAWAPWYVAHTDNKRRARLNIISHLLSEIPYEPISKKDVTLPARQEPDDYQESNLSAHYIPTPFSLTSSICVVRVGLTASSADSGDGELCHAIAPASRGSRRRPLGGLVLVGCAGQGTSAPAPTASSSAPATAATYSSELCSAAADFQKAANAVVHLDASKVGTDGVKTALQDLQTAAQKLTVAAKAQFGPQVADLEKAIASLRATLAGLSGQDSLSTNLGKIAASVGAVEQAAKPIVDSVRTGCPSVPPAEIPPAS